MTSSSWHHNHIKRSQSFQNMLEWETLITVRAPLSPVPTSFILQSWCHRGQFCPHMIKNVSASVNKNELFIVSESPLHDAHFYLGHIAVSLQTKKVCSLKKYLKTTFWSMSILMYVNCTYDYFITWGW